MVLVFKDLEKGQYFLGKARNPHGYPAEPCVGIRGIREAIIWKPRFLTGGTLPRVPSGPSNPKFVAVHFLNVEDDFRNFRKLLKMKI